MPLFSVPSHERTCRFPSWMLGHHQYQNLDRSKTFHFNKAGSSLTITNRDEEKRKLKCNSVEEEREGNFSRIIAQVNFEW